MNSKKNLKKLIREMLHNWETESSYVQQIDAMSPQEVASILDDAMGGAHASGRRFHPAFNKKRLSESSMSLPTEQDIEDFLAKFDRKLEIDDRDYDYDSYDAEDPIFPWKDWKDLNHTEQQILSAINLFTGGHVASVRSPSHFDPTKVSPDKRYNLAGNDSWRTPTGDDYVSANHVMKILGKRRLSPSLLVFRGIKVPDDPRFFESLRPGIEFNNWAFSSFSEMRAAARGFATSQKPGVGILITVPQLKTGASIKNYSQFVNEYEVVSSAKLVIVDYQYQNGAIRHHLTCESY